jgi:hypothetical protein
MDCRAIKENIDLYVDGYLPPAQLRDFEAHAVACDACRKDIDNTLRLKSALAALGELEAPEGLARSAVRKARMRRIPPYAYMTAAAAAVVALAVVLTSGILPNQSFDGSKQSEKVMTAESFLAGAGEESAAMDMAPAAIEEPAEAAPAEEPFVEMEEAPQDEQMAAVTRMEEDMVLMSAPEQLCVVNVPNDHRADVHAILETIVVDYQIEFVSESIEGLEVISFVLPEDALEAIIALTADLPLDGEPTAGQVIEFVFND